MTAAHLPAIVGEAELEAPVRTLLGAIIAEATYAAGELTVRVQPEDIVDVLRALRDDPGLQFHALMDVSGADYPDRPDRFDVNYHLLSLTLNRRLRVKLHVGEDMPVPSVTGLFPVAGWFEREVFDMYGVPFTGNADLRRIITDYGFDGHPLRKDFPMTGYVELRYSETEKRVVYEPVKLQQDFRAFDFLSPWEGAQYELPGDEKASGHSIGAATPVPATGEAKTTPVGPDPAKPGGGGSGGNKAQT